MWGESIWARQIREQLMKAQHPELDLASPDRLMQVDNFRMQNKGGFISQFSQMAMALAKHAAEQAQATTAGAPPEIQQAADREAYTRRRAANGPVPGVPLGVAEAQPGTVGSGRVYQSGSSDPLGTIGGGILPALDRPRGAVVGAIGNPSNPAQGAIEGFKNPRSYADVGPFRRLPTSDLTADFGIGGESLGAKMGLSARDLAGGAADMILDPLNLVGFERPRSWMEAVASSSRNRADEGFGKAVETLLSAPVQYRDLTKNIPVGAGIKDISASGNILDDADAIRKIQAVEDQVREEGGWTADTIRAWQEVTGKRPTASMTRPVESIMPPGEPGSRSAEDIIQGAGNAIVKNAGEADINLRNDLPLLHVLDAVENLKGLQGARNEMVGQLRSRQAGALRGTLENVQGQGMEGLRKVSAARRGAADVPSYTPLKELLDPQTIDNVANHLAERGLEHPPFAVGTAVDAWSNMVDGRWVTPSQLKAFGDVAGLNEQQVKQLTERLSRAGGIEKNSIWDAIKQDPIRAANNTIRTSRLYTLVDFSWMGRLAPTAGIYDPGNYARSVGQAFRSLKNPAIVEDVLKGVDDRALSTGFLPDTQMMREVGLRFGSGESDVNPGLFGKLPLIGRGAKVDQAFTTVLRPQMMQSTVENMVKAGKLTEEQAKDPAILEQIARGINNIGGASNIVKQGGTAELVSSFPSWYASQFELVASAFQRGSISHQMARETLAKLTLMVTAATAIGNVAQGKNPADYIKDGVPQLAIGNDGLTVDLYGPIGELIRHAIRVGERGYEGATPNGLNGGIDVTGGLGGAGHELAGWGRGMLSPLLGMATDLMLGKDFMGTKIRDTQQHTMEYLGRSVAPFSASNFLGLGEKGSDFLSLNERGLAAGALSEFGFRGVHTPSEGQQLYGKLDDLARAMHMQDDQGNEIKRYGDLPPGAKQAIKDAHPDLKDAIDSYGLKQGEEQGMAVEVRQRLESQQAADDRLLEQNPMYAKDWRDNTNERQKELAIRKDQIYSGVDFKKGQWPTLDAYFNKIEQATAPNGIVDWNAVDSWRSTLTDAQNKFIDDNTGLNSLSPVVKQYRDERKHLQQSGFFDISDKTWAIVSKALPKMTADFKDYGAWYDANVNKIAVQFAKGGMPQGLALVEAQSAMNDHPLVQMYQELQNVNELPWVVKHAKDGLADTALKWSFFRPTVDERDIMMASMGVMGQ